MVLNQIEYYFGDEIYAKMNRFVRENRFIGCGSSSIRLNRRKACRLYDYFEAYIGIDQEMKDNTNASVTFEVWVDGNRVFNTDMFWGSTEQREQSFCNA